MEKLKKLRALLVQKIKKPTRRSLAISGLLAVLFITLTIYLVACSEDEESPINPNSDTIAAEATTAPTTEVTTTPRATTATSQTTEPTDTTAESAETTTSPETPSGTNPPQTTTRTQQQTQPPQTPTPTNPPPTTLPPPPPTNPPPPPTDPSPVVTDPPPAHTFTRADMEELLAYGQSLGFGFTFITATGFSSDGVFFGMSEDTKIIVLRVDYSTSTSLSIGRMDDAYSNERRIGERAYSISEAKTYILNHFNSQ
jgi:hypothetical protein